MRPSPPPPHALVGRGHAVTRQPDGSHRNVWWEGDIVEVNGLLATSPMRTAFDLMRQACLVEAVSVTDSFAFRELLELPWFVMLGTLPVLRYDRLTVARHSERLRALHEMSRAIGVLPNPQLPRELFFDPRRPLRW